MSELLKWIDDYEDKTITDIDEQLFNRFNCFKNYLDVPRQNALFLESHCRNKYIESACFVHWLINNIDLQNDVNVAIWISSDMTITTSKGPWTRPIYQENEQKGLRAIRHVVEYLKIPDEHVVFLVPGDTRLQEKIGQFVGYFLDYFNTDNYTAMVWFKCKDQYQPDVLQQMLI